MIALWRTLPPSVRRALKRGRVRCRTWLARTLWTFGPADLTEALRRVGVRPGDLILAHSSWDAFAGYTGTPATAIAAIEAAIAPGGTLAMPTQPFAGSAQAWHARGIVFDPRRTPSAMGLLTELFRRMPGVVRGLHPTHPVAARGPLAETLLADHLRSDTPCGAHSPYDKLRRLGGKLLLLGTDLDALTFNHFVEDRLEGVVPFPLFTTERYRFAYRAPDGSIGAVELRLFNRDTQRRRDRLRLRRELERRRLLRRTRVGRLDILCVTAADVLAVTVNMAHEGRYLYRAP